MTKVTKLALLIIGGLLASGTWAQTDGSAKNAKTKQAPVTAMNSRRVYVLGEVLHTGAVPLLPNMTVLQALATAGFTQFANVKGIYVLRTENGRQVKLPFNYKQVVKGADPHQNIALKPGDTVVVP